MNNEITVEDIIKAIDEIDDIFSEERKEENENFWCGYKYAITRIQNYITKLQQELEIRQYDINNLTHQLAMKKTELDEANDSVTWWHNRFNAVQKECERKDNIINELKKYLEYEIEEWKDVENEWGKIRTSEDENILDKIKELENDL